MIETPRLTLIPLTLPQLQLYLADNHQLEKRLGLKKGHRELVEPQISIVSYFTIPRLQNPATDPLFNTMWMAIDREKQQFVAEAKFKGEPDETGTVEIGYSTYPALHRQGYMTEMVGGLVNWAGQREGVWRVVADTDAENVASQKVLEKAGFRLFDRIENMLWWEYLFTRELRFNEQGYLVSEHSPIAATHQTVSHHFGNVNSHRLLLWHQYLSLRDRIKSERIPILYVWMDGSFTTKEPYPNNIDIIMFIPELYKVQNFRKLMSLGEPFKDLHVLWIGLRDETDPLASAINSIELFKWREQFGTDRTDTPKGFLEIHQ